MDDFSSATFAQAAHVLDSYSADAGRLAEVLRRPGALREQAAVLDASDTARLRHLLSRQTPDGEVYCIIGGLARHDAGFQLNVVPFLHVLYLLHSDIASVRAHIAALRDGQATTDNPGAGGNWQEGLIRQILRDRTDAIHFRSRALAEMMLHLSHIADDPELPALLLRMSGRHAPAAALPPGVDAAGQEDAARRRLELLIRDYVTRIAQAGAALKSDAFDPPRMAAWLREFPANPLPLWIAWRAEPDARVLDDVWIPAELFAPIMQLISGQASHALAFDLPDLAATVAQ